jgi:hypothetical protein
MHWPFDPWPDHSRGTEVEFRLVYDGRLPAASRSETRNSDKDRIRRIFSKQLAELFATHPALKTWSDKDISAERLPPAASEQIRAHMKPGQMYSSIELSSLNYERCGKRYMPLITENSSIACSLDILFLRRDQPGNLIVSGGDLDNRIKVLFDALRLPRNCDEVLSSPEDREDEPVFVLLEDDRLIVDVKVTSDRLLTPRNDGEHINDVRLIIHVKTIIVDSTKWGAVIFG